MSRAAVGKALSGVDAFLMRLPRLTQKSTLGAVLIGVVCAVIGLAVRAAAARYYAEISGFIILLPAVILAAVSAGRAGGWAALATCLAGGWAVVVLTTPEGRAMPPNLGRIATTNFFLVGLFCTETGAWLRRSLHRLEDSLSELTRSRSELQALVDQSAAGIVRLDREGRITAINGRYAELLGLSPEEAVGRTTLDVSHPEDAESTLAALKAIAQGRSGDQLVKRYVHPDGRVVWALVSVRALLGPDGAPIGYIAGGVDITASREAEAAVRESESRFRLLADIAPAPIWLTDARGGIEFANAALVDFCGPDSAALAGQGWRKLVHPDDADRVMAGQIQARDDGAAHAFEARFRRHDDAWRWMRVVVKPRLDDAGGLLGFAGMAFDVTETREALDAAARQQRRQAFLLALVDRLRDMTDPLVIMTEVERALGDLMEVHRVGYGEVDEDAGVVSMTQDWTDGVVSAHGRFSLRDLGAPLIADLAAGETVRVEDVRDDPRTTQAAPAFEALQTRALMRAPLIRNGRLRAFLYVHSAQPRLWTDAEAALLEEVAARTWAEIERARAEAETRESEARFRAVADTAPVLIWVTAKDRSRAFVNQAYVDFYGSTYEAARTADWRACLHPDDQQRILEESLAGEATGEPFSMEARYRRHDGTWRWLKSFSRPRTSGSEVVGFVGVAFDVTDMRDARMRLEESESRFRTVADSAPVLVWMSDDAAQLVFANRLYRTFFGVRSERQLRDSWRRLIHPDDETVFTGAFMRAFEARDRFEALSRVNHPTLGQRWLRTEGVPRFDAEGAFQGYVGASLDVTEAKRAEDDLKRINELLEDRVGEALAEKAQAEAQLLHAQRLEAVGRLTGGVAHDFNNLLTVVIGALDIILRSEDPAKRKKLGEAALSAARRGESLTHQLLAFSRRQPLRPEAVDLNALIREGEPLMRRAVGEAVDFQVRLKRGGARVNVDPAQFEAALLNLIVNARDALGDVTADRDGAPRRPARVSIRTLSCEIGPDDEGPDLPAGRYVCVTVSDTGAGMTAEVIDRVFEPFFTTKAVGKGTGLGLSQVYGFARQSGGGVRVASTVGRGTEVRLYLPPLAEAEAPTRAPTRSTPPPETAFAGGRRLLLVEDDANVAAVAVDLLEGFGFDVQLAETGEAALGALAAGRFDLMLTDVVMPGGMSGVDLARRAARDWPDMRIALTSGYVGDDVDGVLADAPWPFLRKPYSADQLRRLVEGTPAASAR
ncbi:PAS domain S-box protein [Brevundimonas sp.]|uniref:PAS domain S-box protein n=2 Tax=Brevundimonas TaxID=41275 RepID=UPI00257E8353|nr:PAS domain S-box protein [Brevundimonas sp.]